MKNLAILFIVIIMAVATCLTACDSKHPVKRKVSNKIPQEMVGDTAIVTFVQTQFLVNEGPDYGRSLIYINENESRVDSLISTYKTSHHLIDANITPIQVTITSIVSSANGMDTLFMKREYSEAKSLVLGDKIRITSEDMFDKAR